MALGGLGDIWGLKARDQGNGRERAGLPGRETPQEESSGRSVEFCSRETDQLGPADRAPHPELKWHQDI